MFAVGQMNLQLKSSDPSFCYSRAGSRIRLTKAKDKYETNKISENIGSGSGLRDGVQLSACAGHEHDDDRRIDWREHYQHEHFKWLGHNYHLHPRIGLHHVPHGSEYRTGEVLLQ
jgi:hypothetical protein